MFMVINLSIASLHRLLQIDQFIQINMQQEQNYCIYSIGHKDQHYPIKEINKDDFYTAGTSCRKAYSVRVPDHQDDVFRDFNYMLNLQEINEGKEPPVYSTRRIFQLYDKQFDIFAEDYYKESYLDLNGDEELPTFLSEFSMIDREYIKTRFFAKRLNKKGFYQYFVRRNGQYYVEYMDDLIPVSGSKQLPLWGLTLKEPWKIILMKAWIKQKKGIEGVIRAQPYEFIEAFGLPGYRAVSIKKEANFLSHSKFSEEERAKKEAKIKFTIPGFITVGKTRNNQKVGQMGLKRNRAGYKITALAQNINQSKNSSASVLKEENIFKVQSQLPAYWVGEYSVVSGKIRNSFNPQIHKLNIEKQFLASYSQISHVFSKFYIWPDYSSKHGSGNIIEESHKINIDEEDITPYYIFDLQVVEKGSFNLNIDLPFDSGESYQNNIRYSPIKYFMTRVTEDKLDKKGEYQLFDSEYVKGYHKSVNRFVQIQEGRYYIYVKIDRKKERKAKSFTINIHTNATIRKFKLNPSLNTEGQEKLIKQTFYDYSKRTGIRCYVHKEVKDLVVYICNKFDQLGFSFISLYVHPKAAAQLAMNVNRKKLKEQNIDICAQAHSNYGDQSKQDFKVIAKQGETQILVLQKINRTKFKEEQFPPEGTIDFYQII